MRTTRAIITRKPAWRHALIFFAFALLLNPGCTMTSRNTSFNSLSTPDGPALAHINTSRFAIHLFFGSIPFLGNASIDHALNRMTRSAEEIGADQVRIVQSGRTNYWFAFPPITFFLTPIVSNVAGDAITAAGKAEAEEEPAEKAPSQSNL